MRRRQYTPPNMDPAEFKARLVLLGWKAERPGKLVRGFSVLGRDIVFFVSAKDVTANIIYHKQNAWQKNRGAHGGYKRKFKHGFQKAFVFAVQAIEQETGYELDNEVGRYN